MSQRIVRIGIVTFVLAVVVSAASQLAPLRAASCPVPKPNCNCPAIVAPVICPDGCTFINSCRATCAHERNCVPSGE